MSFNSVWHVLWNSKTCKVYLNKTLCLSTKTSKPTNSSYLKNGDRLISQIIRSRYGGPRPWLLQPQFLHPLWMSKLQHGETYFSTLSTNQHLPKACGPKVNSGDSTYHPSLHHAMHHHKPPSHQPPMPCTTTHSPTHAPFHTRPSLPVNPSPILTLTNRGTLELHNTAAAYGPNKKKNIFHG